jgi:hypothetical protein
MVDFGGLLTPSQDEIVVDRPSREVVFPSNLPHPIEIDFFYSLNDAPEPPRQGLQDGERILTISLKP